MWAWSPAARADSVQGTRFDPVERANEVEVRVDRGYANLVVRRTVYNPGDRSDQVVFSLHVPEQAVATRLRTAGADAQGKRVWFEGELLDAEVAAARYQELTGLGGYYPKDPALLSWRHPGWLALQVFPVPSHADKIVEYQLEMPLDYSGGKYRLRLPLQGARIAPEVRVMAVRASDRVRVNGIEQRGAPLVVHGEEGGEDAAQTDVSITLTPRTQETVQLRLADIPVRADRRLVHAAFDAAPRLSRAPRDAAIAIVLDVSRSMHDLTPTLAALRAYVRQLHGEVSVVTFDRRVRTPFGVRKSPAAVLKALSSTQLQLGNGSALDLAVQEADAILASARSQTRRMLVLTDRETRSAFGADAFAALTLRSGAVVHLADVAAGVDQLARDDADAWAKVPRRSGGVLWHAVADTGAPEVFEEWIRPKRIDRLRVDGLQDPEVPDTLPEGERFEHFAFATQRAASVVLRGELWSQPVSYVTQSSDAEVRRWSALVFGSSLMDELSEQEQLHMAMRGGAVSPMTSYLAIEPGVRPSTEGLSLEESGSGGGGHGFGLGLGAVAMRGHPGLRFDPMAFLRSELGAVWRACGGSGRAQVKLETTEDEVVDVIEVQSAGGKNVECLREGVWGVDLSSSFKGRGTFTVEL